VDFAGAECVVGVNAKYVLQALDALDTDEVLFGVPGELDPMTIRPAGENAAEFICVCMPLRL
jgi:DNA polymerase III sliding clamp (beta) subunit (PCNA family)